MPSSRAALIDRVRTLTLSFGAPELLPRFLSQFSTSPSGSIVEHCMFEGGVSALDPTINLTEDEKKAVKDQKKMGLRFSGSTALESYFQHACDEIIFDSVVEEDEEKWHVDETALGVTMRGEARLIEKRNGQGWDGCFLYHVRMVEEGGEIKIAECELYSDYRKARD